MKLQSVRDPAFVRYGRVIEGLNTAPLVALLNAATEHPLAGVTYVPSCPTLEGCAICDTLRDSGYGGMPIQIGYCNGFNTKLNCLEYHRDSELNIPADDIILLVAPQQALVEGRLDTAAVEAFCAPAGSVVELYATTLHFAPCQARQGVGFRVAVVLPKGTNEEKPQPAGLAEDALLWARNKWLIAHPESDEAGQGAFVGLTGTNLDIAALIAT